MMFGSPFYSNRKRAMEEEAQRRAQLEQYYLQKEEEAARRRQRDQLLSLREPQRQETEYADTICRRQMIEKENYRKNQLRQMGYYDDKEEETIDRQQHPNKNQPPVEGDERPSHKVVQSPDGRLYRAKLNDKPKSKPKTNYTTAKKQQPGHKYLSSVDDREEMAPTPEPTTTKRVPLYSIVNPTSKKKSSTRLKKSNKQAAVVVEDVLSDSEDEDELKSIWRNRRPSPGQWIEPVEEFAGMKI